MLVSLSVVINSSIKTKIARNEAEIESSNSQAVINFLNDELLLTYNNSIQNKEEITVPSVFKVMSEKIEGKFENKPVYEASIRMKLGRIFLSLEDYGEAGDNFEKAMIIYSEQLGEDHLTTLKSGINFGLCCAKQGRFDEAITHLQEVIRINPDLAEAYSGLGITYLELGRYEEAIEALVQAINLKPNSEKVYTNLGYAYLNLGRNEEAIEA